MAEKGKRILVIEDQVEIASIWSEMLGHFGYSYEWVSDGQSGINAINALDFDLIITDIHMPVLDGYAVLEYLKEHKPDQLVMVSTGHLDEDEKLEAYNVHTILHKPYNMVEVIRSFDDLW